MNIQKWSVRVLKVAASPKSRDSNIHVVAAAEGELTLIDIIVVDWEM